MPEFLNSFVSMKAAYKAYETYVEHHGSEPLLPKLNYTQKQLFWFSLGSTECDDNRFGFSGFNLGEITSNIEEFVEDFSCEYRSSKCSVF